MTKKVSSKMSKYKVVWSDNANYKNVFVYADTNRLIRRYEFVGEFAIGELINKAEDLGINFHGIRDDYVMQASLAVILYEEHNEKALLEHIKREESKKKLKEWDGVIDGKYRQIV